VDPAPAIVANTEFRRALTHAIDRKELADSLQGGVVPVADSMVDPNTPDYALVEPRIVRYPYDPRRAVQLIEGLGYMRAGDGIFRIGEQRLAVEIRSSAARAVNRKAVLAIADYWRQVGVVGEPFTVPPQLAADREQRSNFPGFEVVQQPNDLEGFDRLHSTRAPLPENNYRVTGNRSRYRNPEFDALIDRFLVTIPRRERVEAVGQIIHHMTDQVLTINLFHGADPTLWNKRLQHVRPRTAWNAYQWDVS
jgi:peptide/nickel transport system substrate-binding protein